MDNKFFSLVMSSVDDVFEILVKVEVLKGERLIKKTDELTALKSITGMMNLISNNSLSTIAIIFPEEVIFNIANAIMPVKVERINEVVIDLVGEITNIVSGGIKIKAEHEGYLFNLSLPTITLGSEYLIPHLPKTPITQIQMGTELGNFIVEVSLSGSVDFCPLPIEMPDEFEDILF